MVKAIIFLYEPDLSSLPSLSDPGSGATTWLTWLTKIFDIWCDVRCDVTPLRTEDSLNLPVPHDLSLTVERVKPIWLIHLTIFIFIAQSDKLIWDLTNGGAVTPPSWDMLTNHRREATNQTKFAKLIRTLAKNKSHRILARRNFGPFYQPPDWPWSGCEVYFTD